MLSSSTAAARNGIERPGQIRDGRSRLAQRIGWAVFALVMLLTLWPRLANLGQPIIERHGFRQTQTAMTIWNFVTDGIRLVNYKTPIFGPPWKIPFEFPVYQASVAMLVKLTGMEIDPAARLTSIIYFYLSALVLFDLVRLICKSAGCAAAVVAVYSAIPLSIVWSRTCMIETCALFFCIAYAWGTTRAIYSAWPISEETRRNSTGSWIWTVVAIIAGSLAALVKITTVPMVAPLVGLLCVWHFVSIWQLRKTLPSVPGERISPYAKQCLTAIIRIALLVLIPLILGKLWADYADKVRLRSAVGNALQNVRMTPFIYGTWAQRQEIFRWNMLLIRMNDAIVPPAAFGLLAAGAVWASRRSTQIRILFWGAFTGILCPVLIFFNLHFVHDYYQVALLPAFAIVAGIGLYQTLIASRGIGPFVLLGIILWLCYWQSRAYFNLSYTSMLDEEQYQVAKMLAASTVPADQVLVVGQDWSPAIPYLARRRCLMQPPWANYTPSHLRNVAYYLTNNNNHPAKNRWASVRLVGETRGFFLYRVEGLRN